MPGAVETGGPIATLHVYTNLEQVPVLVLSRGLERQKRRFADNRFRVSLDGGVPFRPVHVREEGDDPIALSIVIDTTGPASRWISKLQDALDGLAASDLKSEDRVSIYAIGCVLTRTALNIPPSPERLRLAVERALQPSRTGQPGHHTAACRPSVPLFDALGHMAQELALQPGRRILFAITDGVDGGSQTHWAELKTYLQARSISVFGLMPADFSGRRSAPGAMSSMLPRGGLPLKPVEDYFDLICQLSGGVELLVHDGMLSKKLAEAVQMVRARYIVEYPRGDNDKAGEHLLDVSILKSDAYVRPAGISVPIADRKLLDNPLTIPGEPGKAPEPGERRILLPNPIP